MNPSVGMPELMLSSVGIPDGGRAAEGLCEAENDGKYDGVVVSPSKELKGDIEDSDEGVAVG